MLFLFLPFFFLISARPLAGGIRYSVLFMKLSVLGVDVRTAPASVAGSSKDSCVRTTRKSHVLTVTSISTS